VVVGLDAKTSIRIDFPDCVVVGEEIEDEEKERDEGEETIVAVSVELEILSEVVGIAEVAVEVSMVSGRLLSSVTTSTCRTETGGGSGSTLVGENGGKVVNFSIAVDEDDPQIEGFTSVTISSFTSSVVIGVGDTGGDMEPSNEFVVLLESFGTISSSGSD